MRLRLLLTAVLFGALLPTMPVRAMDGVTKDALTLTVYRKDRELGTATVAFSRMSDGTIQVISEMQMEYNVLFFTAFRYSQRVIEYWKDGALVAIDAETDDDGELLLVRGRRTQDGFAVEGPKGEAVLPPDVVPTTWWNPLTAQASHMLDIRKGQLLNVAVSPVDSDAPDARVIFVDGPKTDFTIRYCGEALHWCGLYFEARGAEITMQPEDEMQAP